MNINRAKRIAGIRASEMIAGRGALQRAERHCFNLIVEARRAGDEARAAKLSEAKEYFKGRMRARNSCMVCGEPINRGATHCRLHQSGHIAKTLPAPTDQQPRAKRRKRNTRIPLVPSGGTLAQLGFYTPEVQHVVKKWEKQIGDREEWLDAYFAPAAMAVILRKDKLEFSRRVFPHDWPVIFELGLAVSAVCRNTAKPAAWLLNRSFDFDTAVDDGFPSWHDIQNRIADIGGPRFTQAALKSAAKRMRLLPTQDMEKELRGTWR